MIYVSGSEIYTWNPQLDIRTSIHVFTEYTHLQFGPYKGNPSKDGAKLVVRATNGQGALVAFAYELSTQQKHPDIETNLSGRNAWVQRTAPIVVVKHLIGDRINHASADKIKREKPCQILSV